METLVYLNGELVPEEEAKISIWDMGFLYSAAFMEAARTFGHRIYRLPDHLDRMQDSMRYAGLAPLVSKEDMGRIVEETVAAKRWDEAARLADLAARSARACKSTTLMRQAATAKERIESLRGAGAKRR